MRILHTSDWHLGRTLHGESLLDAQRSVLSRIVEMIDEHKVDAVIVAGDVYDRAVPPVEAVELLADTLQKLSDRVPTIVTSGNHDSAPRLGFGSRLYRDTLHLRTDVRQGLTPVMLRDDAGVVAVYPIPFLDPDVARFTWAGDSSEPLPRSHEAVLAEAMRQIRDDFAERRTANPQARMVVIAHAFVVGGGIDRMSRSESERDLHVGGSEAVAASVFEGAHYVALGHLHGAQQAITNTPSLVRYSGSPLRYSFSETSQEKSVTIVDLDDLGGCEFRLIALDQPRGMGVIVGDLDDVLTSPSHEALRDAWVHVTLTDAGRPTEMIARVRQRFPKALVIRHAPSSGPLVKRRSPQVAASSDPIAIASMFVRHVSGVDASEPELDAVRLAYERVTRAERTA